MMKQSRILILLSLILLLIEPLYAQISISTTSVEYSLTYKQDSIYRILTFWKDKDSTIYTSVKYSVISFETTNLNTKLSEEIPFIKQLWNKAEDSIQYNLQSFNIGYPLLYSDVLKNHIQAFLNSKDWQSHVKQNGRTLNYEIIKKIMLENNIYKPLNDFLKTKGYYISSFETEKHGFITKENLQKAGFTGSEIIPMPFIVWITLKKQSSR